MQRGVKATRELECPRGLMLAYEDDERTKQPVVGATRDAILFADATLIKRRGVVCEPTRLMSAAR